jgi:hypothetical protein
MSADQPDHTKRRCASLDFQAGVTLCHGAVGDAAIAFDRTDDGRAPGYHLVLAATFGVLARSMPANSRRHSQPKRVMSAMVKLSPATYADRASNREHALGYEKHGC